MKRIIYSASFITLISASSFAQYNTFPTSGNVGIGTTSPSSTLHITGGQAIIETPGVYGANGLKLTNTTTGSQAVLQSTNNGIYVTDASGAPTTLASGAWANPWDGSTFVATIGRWDIQAGGFRVVDLSGTGDHFSYLDQYGIFRRSSITLQNGNVSIGAPSVAYAQEYKLAVNGDAIFRKVRVTQENWPDYVFGPTYRLPSLQEVEAYIQRHKHLPGIASAATIEIEGLDVGENQAALLKKIEELTLYIIEQNKKMELLEARVNRLSRDQN